MGLSCPPRIRIREQSAWDGSAVVGTHTYEDRSGETVYSSNDYYLNGSSASYRKELCSDQSHPLGRGGKHRCGGPLIVNRIDHLSEGISGEWRVKADYGGWTFHKFKGTLYPNLVGGTSPGLVLQPDSFGDISAYGPTAWKKYLPGRPQAQVATFLGELRDLPRMLHDTANFFRNLTRGGGNPGNNYLAVQFGWIPFLKDIREMIKLSQDIERQLEMLRKHNGQWMLRKGGVMQDTNVLDEWEGGWAFQPAPPSNMLEFSDCTHQGKLTYGRKVWFSGRFRYYIPLRELNSVAWRGKTIRALFGANVTPEVVWELIPWSWLIDYFTNAGDIFANLSNGAVDCVAKYAYVMGTTYHKATQTSHVKFVDYPRESAEVTRIWEYKSRVHADPFGFGTSSDLSDKQIAILAALGISRF